jgi:hypothetical protein
MKQCRSCKEYKENSQFYRYARNNGGLRHDCKKCTNAYNFEKTKLPTNIPRKKVYERRSRLKHKYGISLLDYEKMLKKQNYMCPICNTHQKDIPKNLAIDHDHKTGKVRGLLCGKCNRAIGLFYDSSENCTRAAKYLDDSKNAI